MDFNQLDFATYCIGRISLETGKSHMTLYHASNTEVVKPDLNHSREYLDFISKCRFLKNYNQNFHEVKIAHNNMKKGFILVLILISSALTIEGKDNNTDWAKFYRYASANDTLKMKRAKVKAVIMGDSITDNWLKFDRPFFTGNNIVGRGISGQVTSQMLIRFRDDVIALHPKYVVILAGTNDIALNNGTITLEHIMGNIESMCELARYHKIKVVLCSVLPASEYRWRPQLTPASDIKKLNSMIESYASEHKLIKYVDFWSLLANTEGGLDPDKAADGVHPNLATYKLMEDTLLSVIK